MIWARRFQDDYVNDTAGLPGPVSATSVRWLRLERSGEAVTGYDSTDGAHWSAVDTVRLDGLGSRVQVGLFVASPPIVHGAAAADSVATAVFGELSFDGSGLDGAWTGQQVGADSPSFSGYPGGTTGAFTQAGGSFTVTGAGDIAPAVRTTLPGGGTIDAILTGSFAALITLIVIGTLFITAEYQDEMIRLTLSASPRRGRVLMAKAIVLGTVTFAATLAGAAIAVPLGEHLARANGVYLFSVAAPARLRVEIGTAALLATAAVPRSPCSRRLRPITRSRAITRRTTATIRSPPGRGTPSWPATRRRAWPSPPSSCAGGTRETRSTRSPR